MKDRRQQDPKHKNAFRKSPIKKWLGRAIQVTGVTGILLSVICIVSIPILAPRISSSVERMMLTITEEITQAAISINQIGFTLVEGVDILEAAEVSVRSVEGSMEDLKPLLGSTANLLGEHAPKIIEDTRNALLSAEEGARAVDQVLRGLARLGPLTGVTYDPEQPLDVGISNVSASLEPFPSALRKVGDELDESISSLEEVRVSLDGVGNELKDFSGEVFDRTSILTTLEENLQILSDKIDHTRGNIQSMVLIGSIFFELLFMGNILMLSAIFYVGRNMTRSG